MTEPSELKAIFQAITLPCMVLKPEGEHFRIADANEAYLQLTGIPHDALVGKISWQVYTEDEDLVPDRADILMKSLHKVTTLKCKDRMEGFRYDIPCRNTGNLLEKYWDLENVPVSGGDGNLKYVLHMAQDVTEKVISEKKEQKLRREVEKNRQQYSHYVETNPDGLYSLDKEGNFLHANQGLADMAEISLEELLTRNFLPFCAPEDRDLILKHFSTALGGESTKFEAKFITSKEKNLILEISLLPMKAEGQVLGVYGIARDLTPMKQSESIIVTKKKYLKANAAFINNLLRKELEKDSLQESLGMIGEAVDVDRIYYIEAHSGPDTAERLLHLHTEWTNEFGNPKLDDLMATRLGKLIGTLGQHQIFNTNISELQDGPLRQALQFRHTKATVILPIFLKEKLHGLIGFDNCTRERHWSEEEISYLKTLANNLTTIFEKRAAKAALKEQEEALKRSEKKFRALVQEGTDLIGILDPEGNYIFVSDSTSRILGIKPEEFIGRNAVEFIHPEDQEDILQQFASLNTISQFKLPPYRFRNKKGEWLWLETTLTKLLDDPAVQGIVANSRDVTTLMIQEREIKQINERYRLAATATQDLMYDWDLVTGKFIRFHKDLPDFLGHAISKVDQRTFWYDHIHPKELECFRKSQEAALLDKDQDHIHSEYRFRRADGSYAYIIDRVYIIRDGKGKAIRMVGATSDISDLKANLEALKFANKRFNLATKATKEGIWDWNIVTGMVTRGMAFEKISGYSLNKETQDLSFWFAKIHPQDRDRVQLSLEEAVQNADKRQWREEYRLVKFNGEIAYIMDRGFIVRDTTGQAVRMVGSALDTTESRMAIKRIKHQNKLLQEIAWDQSHLVRAPLARMKGLLDLLDMGEITGMSKGQIYQHLNESYSELDQIIRAIIRKSENIDKSARKEDFKIADIGPLEYRL